MWKPIANGCLLLSALLGRGSADVAISGPAGHLARDESANHGTRRQEAQVSSYSANDIRTTGPYCGVYSLFACLNALGSSVDLRNLVTTRSVSSWQGSRASDLLAACEDSGVYAKCFTHLRLRELRESTVPMILHVRSSAASASFNHWVAFLGFDGEDVRILDAPHPLQELAGAELLAMWDGLGIAVSKEPVSARVIWLARVEYLTWVLAVLCIIYLLRRFLLRGASKRTCADRASSVGELLSQVCAVVGSAVIIAIAFHAINDAGFLRNRRAVADVMRRYYRPRLSEVSLVEMERRVGKADAILIDARRRRDYEAGTIPRSLSLPVDATPSKRQKALASIATDKQVIVYCQSAHCGYADEVARYLKFSGVKDVAIYRGGYREWSALRVSVPRRSARGAELRDDNTRRADAQSIPRIVGESRR